MKTQQEVSKTTLPSTGMLYMCNHFYTNFWLHFTESIELVKESVQMVLANEGFRVMSVSANDAVKTACRTTAGVVLPGRKQRVWTFCLWTCWRAGLLFQSWQLQSRVVVSYYGRNFSNCVLHHAFNQSGPTFFCLVLVFLLLHLFHQFVHGW